MPLDPSEKNRINSMIQEAREKIKELEGRLQRAEATLRELRNR